MNQISALNYPKEVDMHLNKNTKHLNDYKR